MDKATLGGGCFWCLEAVFEQLIGVDRVVSGYAGGVAESPSYEAVCSGGTGHAEVIDITFDPAQISYDQLLEVFFAIHDSTTLNRQGADVGTQYRSVIFTHGDDQHAIAQAFIDELTRSNVYGSPVVTELQRAPRFYPAESYHQGYFRNNPAQGYCAFVVAPKALAVRRKFASLIKPAAQ
ncbi:MAG: peptide-methionine (S)-S-oxide reductase MsrA [Azonexus sp.]|nr:peptide-methionine (S)-S-oxide reductase MsrA [Azonexus sp.]MDP3637582.1 peptide-methionine (S)-S-oxide reductase MsrA [Azonexus sp.]MDZ4316150.1 peptide-methionine (S)-S-oxide reductase MsrA [Azonexus sp.]